jgi:mono/diheme cytochrome c family protein
VRLAGKELDVNQTIARLVLPGAVLLCVLGAQNPRPEFPKGKEFDSVEGQALFGTYCAVCHGADGKGSGPMAKVLRTPPPDLTHIWMRNGGRFSLERVQKIISGEAEVVAHGTSEMPLWGPIFSQGIWDQDLGRIRIYNLAKYLEKIQAN